MHIGGCLGACDVCCLWCCIRVWPGRRRPKHENGNPTGKVMQDLFKGGLKRVISYGWGLPFVMLFLFICCLLKKKKLNFITFSENYCAGSIIVSTWIFLDIFNCGRSTVPRLWAEESVPWFRSYILESWCCFGGWCACW